MKENLQEWEVNSKYNLGIKESLSKSGFQVEIPEAFRGSNYRKYIIIKVKYAEKGRYELEGIK